jgi:hypothetical protein
MILMDQNGQLHYEWVWAGSEGEYDQAISIKSNLAPRYSAGWFVAWIRHPRTPILHGLTELGALL